MYWIIQWLNVDDRVVQQWQQDMCIVADRGLQGVFGLCTGDYRGAEGVPGKMQEDGKEIQRMFIRTGVFKASIVKDNKTVK